MNLPTPSMPRILLAEDDPVSAAFLLESISRLPAQAVLATTRAEARTVASTASFDLLLLDANLPDGSGIQLLHTLRHQGITATALAHTADCDPQVHAQLVEAGFVQVLHKPMPVPTLLHALQLHLPAQAFPIWDNAAALAAMGGKPEHVSTLRALFLQELSGQQQRIISAAQNSDEASIRAELHRLAAACGFVGAARLLNTVRQLQASPLSAHALQNFEHECQSALRVDDL